MMNWRPSGLKAHVLNKSGRKEYAHAVFYAPDRNQRVCLQSVISTTCTLPPVDH